MRFNNAPFDREYDASALRHGAALRAIDELRTSSLISNSIILKPTPYRPPDTMPNTCSSDNQINVCFANCEISITVQDTLNPVRCSGQDNLKIQDQKIQDLENERLCQCGCLKYG